jgi:ABC-type ATPase with predicted acetyltransferase domain
MPTFDIVKQVKPKKTFRVASVIGKFDLQSESIVEHFIGNIDIPKDWQIGLIVGKSGTGKTTIAKQLFPDSYVTNYKYEAETILDDMPKSCSVEQITSAFNSVGFSSPPSWLKPYSVLSNGEKMRVDLARAILEDAEMFVFDEFTSVVDRNVAQIGSFAMQKAIRKTSKRFIAVTCHFDVQDWLLPDWVFNTDTMTFEDLQGFKKKDPTSSSRYSITQIKQYGRCLQSITI